MVIEIGSDIDDSGRHEVFREFEGLIAGKPAPTGSRVACNGGGQSRVEPLTGTPRSGKNRRCNSLPGLSARMNASPTRNA
ncbi:hypothetical protein D3C84_1098730 [compost metagenome]